MLRTQLTFLARLLRLGPPPTLIRRVGIWIVRGVAREFAVQWLVLWALIGAGLLALGAAGTAVGVATLIVVAAALVTELRFAWLASRSARAIDRELHERIAGEPAASRFPRTHLLMPLLMLAPRGVRRRRGVVYHREDRLRLRLDIYRPKPERGPGELRPALIQVHGGGWIAGSRLEQGIPLLNHMARNGWVGFNIDYRLSPRATMPDHVIDVKRAIAWVRENAAELGIDPQRICLTGGSAGGHLTALAALTADDRTLQPGFESADTSVAAAVPFYGVYDFTDLGGHYYPELREWLFPKIVIKCELVDDPEVWRGCSPTFRVNEAAPPFLIFHGEDDSLVPVGDARDFAERLSAVSRNEVVYAELPGAEHAFDLLPSLRTARVVEGIERFLRTVVAAPPTESKREPALTA